MSENNLKNKKPTVVRRFLFYIKPMSRMTISAVSVTRVSIVIPQNIGARPAFFEVGQACAKTQLPIEPEYLADEISAAEAHCKGEDHYEKGHFSNRENGVDAKRCTEKHDRDLKNLFLK